MRGEGRGRLGPGLQTAVQQAAGSHHSPVSQGLRDHRPPAVLASPITY